MLSLQPLVVIRKQIFVASLFILHIQTKLTITLGSYRVDNYIYTENSWSSDDVAHFCGSLCGSLSYMWLMWLKVSHSIKLKFKFAVCLYLEKLDFWSPPHKRAKIKLFVCLLVWWAGSRSNFQVSGPRFSDSPPRKPNWYQIWARLKQLKKLFVCLREGPK